MKSLRARFPSFWSGVFALYIAAGLLYWAIQLPWIPLALVLLTLVAYFGRQLHRWNSLRKKGYYVRWQNGAYLYEETRQDSNRQLKVAFENTEPGHWELFVPSEAEWRALVPEWAFDRRAEIISKVVEKCKSSDVHYPDDWKA